MAEIYLTTEGDTVDLIAFRRFGAHGMEAAILGANPFLAALQLQGALPAGVSIFIPTPEAKRRPSVQNVWGSGE